MVSPTDRSEIAFFDLETTVPTRPGQGFAILEFGSILVCPKKLIELQSYETLVKPHDMSLITSLSVRANGITADAVISAPSFSDVADKVYDLLHGRIWAGHNILRFDCVRLREAFSQINRAPPEPKGTIDSLALLTQRFGRRAGDMKMASLAAYFGLGKQSHRSLDDVRMNFEVLKYCATVLFLESSLPDIFTENSWISPNATTRNRSNARAVLEGTGPSTSPPSSSRNIENQVQPGSAQVQDQVQPGSAQCDPFDLGPLIEKIENEPLQSNEPMDEESSTDTPSRAIIESTEFLELDQVSITSVTVSVVPFFCGPQKIQILHNNTPLQIHCSGLKVRFGLSTRFVDHAGRPRLNFVVDVSPNLCGILDACDDKAKRFVDSDSNSEWRPVVNRKPGFYNSPTIRLQLPSITEGDSTRWTTEIYQKSSSSSPSSSSSSLSIQQVVFNRYDVSELEALIRPGSLVDAYFSLEPYDYQQNAGIRLVAKKLIVESN